MLHFKLSGRRSRGEMVNMYDFNIVVSEIEPQSLYYVHFWTNTLENGKNIFYQPTYALNSTIAVSPVDWNCRIHRLHPCWEVPPNNDCPEYDTKLSDGEAQALEFWGMRSTCSLPSPPGPVWLGVIAPDQVLSMGRIELLEL